MRAWSARRWSRSRLAYATWCERILEAVREVGEEAGLVKEPGGHEVGEGGAERVGGQLGDRLEQRLGHLDPDDGRGLGQGLCVVGEPVEPGGEAGLRRARA